MKVSLKQYKMYVLIYVPSDKSDFFGCQQVLSMIINLQ